MAAYDLRAVRGLPHTAQSVHRPVDGAARPSGDEVRLLLDAWNLGDDARDPLAGTLAEDVMEVYAELVDNALVHGTPHEFGTVCATIRGESDKVLIAVEDSSVDVPLPRDRETRSGGLFRVWDSIVVRGGKWSVQELPSGKKVTAVLPRLAAPAYSAPETVVRATSEDIPVGPEELPTLMRDLRFYIYLQALDVRARHRGHDEPHDLVELLQRARTVCSVPAYPLVGPLAGLGVGGMREQVRRLEEAAAVLAGFRLQPTLAEGTR
ncbi:hypothetical protein ACIO3O_37440 [Streptomyces sp. NPDC087440]|uniref:hypothetical protein n=1 Tax=Streptomyces sp. NPDC087440 TaxID=3365790 RepID=UPI0037FD705A